MFAFGFVYVLLAIVAFPDPTPIIQHVPCQEAVHTDIIISPKYKIKNFFSGLRAISRRTCMPFLFPVPNVLPRRTPSLPKMLVVCVYAWFASSSCPAPHAARG